MCVCVCVCVCVCRYFTAANPTLGALLVQVAAGLVLYDFCFFWLHYAMHVHPRIGRLAGHSVHHK